MLDEFSVDFPSEAEIESAICDLHPFVSNPRKQLIDVENLKRLLFLSLKEVIYISRMFWALNLLFIALGGIITFISKVNPCWTIFILSPVPFLTGLVEAFKSRNIGLLELESTLKYSAKQVIFSKMLIVGLFNLMSNILIMEIFSFTLHVEFSLATLLTYWVMPVTLLSGIALVIVTKFRHVMAAPIVTTMWLAITLFLINFQPSAKFIEQINITTIIIIILISVLVSIYMIRFIKRGDLIDIDN